VRPEIGIAPREYLPFEWGELPSTIRRKTRDPDVQTESPRTQTF